LKSKLREVHSRKVLTFDKNMSTELTVGHYGDVFTALNNDTELNSY